MAGPWSSADGIAPPHSTHLGSSPPLLLAIVLLLLLLLSPAVLERLADEEEEEEEEEEAAAMVVLGPPPEVPAVPSLPMPFDITAGLFTVPAVGEAAAGIDECRTKDSIDWAPRPPRASPALAALSAARSGGRTTCPQRRRCSIGRSRDHRQ